MREAGFGIKAATITPEGKDDVGSPNRILREEVDGKVIIRTGRRIPGVVGRSRASTTRSRSCGWRSRTPTAPSSGARARRAPTTRSPTARRRSRARPAARSPSTPSAPPSARGRRLRRAEVDRLPRLRGHAQGGARRRRRAPPGRRVPAGADRRHYAGLISGVAETPLVIPALNRDGDCLSDLVLPMFGSIAGAESVLLAFDDDHEIDVAMAEAPHGTAPSLLGKDLANPMAMILACAAVLQYAHARAHAAPTAPRARSTRACSRRPPAGPRRSTSAATPAPRGSPTPWSRRSAPRSTSGRRWGLTAALGWLRERRRQAGGAARSVAQMLPAAAL